MTKRQEQPAWIAIDDRRWNHIRTDVSVFSDLRLDAYHLSVYHALVLHAEVGTGLTERSVDTLCRDARAQERAVRYRLKDLEAWGYIEIVRTFGKASTFRLLPAPTPALSTAPPGTDPGMDPGMKRRANKEYQEDLKDRGRSKTGSDEPNPQPSPFPEPADEPVLSKDENLRQLRDLRKPRKKAG